MLFGLFALVLCIVILIAGQAPAQRPPAVDIDWNLDENDEL